jgi:hypothetical protein
MTPNANLFLGRKDENHISVGQWWCVQIRCTLAFNQLSIINCISRHGINNAEQAILLAKKKKINKYYSLTARSTNHKQCTHHSTFAKRNTSQEV